MEWNLEGMKQFFTKCQTPVKSLVSSQVSLENGMMKETLRLLEHPEGCGCLTLPVSIQDQTSLRPNKKMIPSSSCIQESQVPSKKMISVVNKNSSRITLTNIPDQSRSLKSQISGQALTLKDPDCYEFWDLLRKEKYQKLSWLQGTGLQDLDLNSLNGYAKSLELKSWFSTLKIQPQNLNSETTSWQSSKFTVVDGMEEEGIKTKLKTLKLRIKPTMEQKKMLNQWAGCVRFLYNKTIALLTNPKNTTLCNEFKIRNRFVPIRSRKTRKMNNFYYNKSWLKSCPSSIRQSAIYEAKANLKACYSNLKAGNIKSFTAPFKTKKKESLKGWSFTVESQSIQKDEDKLMILHTILKEMKYCGTKQLHKLIPGYRPDHDCKIQKTEFGEYFLLIPYSCIPKPSKPEPFTNPATIDPGVRKFATLYAPNSQECFMMGNRWSTDIMKILYQLDHLYSIKSKDKPLIKRLRKRVFYLKKELRDQCANFIAKRYDVVLMPKLDTGSLSIKAGRRLTTKTVRQMLQAGHSKFFYALKDKCWENGTKFLHVREEYTSQTCPHCGKLNKCNEVYFCKHCKFSCDRDIVGALNILLKATR